MERRYIQYVLQRSGEARFVGRAGRRIVVLDRAAMADVLARLDGARPWDRAAWRPWPGGDIARRNATLRRLSTGPGLGPAGFTYLNVGHTHLNARWLTAVREAGAGMIAAMIHDTIPLDTPAYQTPASVRRFESRFRAVIAHADRVLTNSDHTADRVAHWARTFGAAPRTLAIHLGIEPAGQIDRRDDASHCYFVQLGTIEPRKDTGLLLDVWEGFDLLPPAERPHLHLVGARGWGNADVFRRLDTAAFMGRSVFEHGPLGDAEARRLLAGARALLFPSHAEGFGLPVLEALQLGVPVIATDLPVLREVAGNTPLYMTSRDANTWRNIIKTTAEQNRAAGTIATIDSARIPRWDAHFEGLEALIG